ncbi:hypothetical protein JCM11641_001773 [Rhodosporidiobolus odoratus]
MNEIRQQVNPYAHDNDLWGNSRRRIWTRRCRRVITRALRYFAAQQAHQAGRTQPEGIRELDARRKYSYDSKNGKLWERTEAFLKDRAVYDGDGDAVINHQLQLHIKKMPDDFLSLR